MKLLLLAIFSAAFAAQSAWSSVYPALRPGMPLPSVTVMDEHDHPIDLKESFRPTPGSSALLVPVFTRCHMSCPVLVNSLETAIQELQKESKRTPFQITLLSFDAGDTASDLRTFREHEKIPSEWKIVRAKDPSSIRQFFDHFSYSIMDSDGGFSHPSQVFILDNNLKWAGSLLGPQLTVQDLSAASETGITTDPEYLILLGALGLLISLITILLLAHRRKQRRDRHVTQLA